MVLGSDWCITPNSQTAFGERRDKLKLDRVWLGAAARPLPLPSGNQQKLRSGRAAAWLRTNSDNHRSRAFVSRPPDARLGAAPAAAPSLSFFHASAARSAWRSRK